MMYTCFLSGGVSASSQLCVFVHTCVSVFVCGESRSCAWVLCLSYLCADGELRCLETGCDVYVFICVCVCV